MVQKDNNKRPRQAKYGQPKGQGVVNSYLQEFGYELLSSVPYAYEMYLNGSLKETVSGLGSSALYYFSPKHTEVKGRRGFSNTVLARKIGHPYTKIHSPERPELQYPPYKERYRNNEYRWEKPTLCICNRYNKEWNKPPINYFNPKLLDVLFGMLKDKYEIIYFAVDLPNELEDNNHSMHLSDTQVASRHKVKIFQSFGGNWNETMMKIFANCEHYITMNGGYSILASYFSGTNIIYSKPGRVQTKEIRNNSFWRWYPNINGVRTLHVPSYEKLLERVKTLYIDEVPVVNAYTTNLNAVKSLLEQDYPNVNIIFHAKSSAAVVGSRKYPVRMVREKPKMNMVEVRGIVDKNYISKLYGR